MKMRSVLVPLLLTSGSALYAMQFPVFEDPQLYESLITHAMRLRAHLPAEIKRAQQKLQQLLVGNPDQAAISEVVDDLIKLYLQKLEMDLTLTYINRADQFIRNCQNKMKEQAAELQAIKDQEPLHASGGESSISLSTPVPETVRPETVAVTPKVPRVSTDEEEEPENQPEGGETEGEESEEEEPSELKTQVTKDKEKLGDKGANERAALKQARDQEIREEAKKLQEQEKEGTAPAGWRDYIVKKYQDAKNWYYGKGTEGAKEEE